MCLSVGRGKIVGRMRRPVGLPNDLAAIHEVLLAEELEDRGHVHQLDAVPLRRADHARVPGTDVGAACFCGVAELAHRVNSAAHSLLGLEHENIHAGGFEGQRRVQPGDAGADDHDIAIHGRHR